MSELGIENKNQKLIVISQSCDIAHHSIEDEPEVEIIICSEIESLNAMMTNSQNPRVLNLEAIKLDPNSGATPLYLELKAKNKRSISKDKFIDQLPDETIKLDDHNSRILCQWLASRYNRLALPSEFNERMRTMRNFKKLLKKTNNFISALYISVEPNREIESHETYTVNLLALTNVNSSETPEAVKKLINQMATHMEENNIDTNTIIRSEKETSVATIKALKKYNFDHFSFRDTKNPTPPEV
ncbi:hypothetical protein GCM10011365_07380 [Marinicella pacifica]|uniref:Uncharacterized protein n=1 Tax=Marinicella pacifica TaxID=1171543 RepID=A0A917FKW3_9GAMM|nr:hypothetical protein [Marinicella pacifica]GGF88735.1 hypothetical protein GCM10011365_07380 [Marinicella pacifica]